MESKVRKITNLILFVHSPLYCWLLGGQSSHSLLAAVSSKHDGVLRSQLRAAKHRALVLQEARNTMKNNPKKQPFCDIYENTFFCIILLEI